MANLERQLSFFLSEPFLLARRKLAEDRLMGKSLKPLDPGAPPLSVFELLDFYEHIALLVKKDHLDVYDVWHTFYEWLQPVYFDLREILEDHDGQWVDALFRPAVADGSTGYDSEDQDESPAGRKEHKKLWTAERIVEHYEYEIQIGGRPRRIARQSDIGDCAFHNQRMLRHIARFEQESTTWLQHSKRTTTEFSESRRRRPPTKSARRFANWRASIILTSTPATKRPRRSSKRSPKRTRS